MQEIAKILRSTDKMAASFVKGVQERTGPNTSEEVILAAIRHLNPRSIDIKRVTTAVKKEMARQRSGPRHNPNTETIRVGKPSQADPPPAQEDRQVPSLPSEAGASRRAAPRTLLAQLDEVLVANWLRAEREGFEPERFAAHDFVRAVHRYCDPRDATRSRIVRACKKIDRQDIIITPPTVADLIRKES